jgi:hypothetical protein
MSTFTASTTTLFLKRTYLSGRATTTGIPKSFLMEVNRPAPKAGDEEEEDEDAVNGVKAGVMLAVI